MLKYTIAKISTVAFSSVNIAFGFILFFIEHDSMKNPNVDRIIKCFATRKQRKKHF